MLLLTSTSDIVRVVTDASADVRAHASWVDNASGTITPGRTNTASIALATTTTIVGSPGSSTQRNAKLISLYNNHASTSVTCRVEHYDGTTAEQLANVVLAAGESLVMDAAGVWTHYDSNKGPYVGLGPMATQADMETATSTTKVVNPSNFKWHPGAVKAWGRFDTAGATTAGYNVDAPTDNGTGDITVNITTDFSGAAVYECQVTVEMTSTTYTVANARTPHVRNAGLAAGTVRCDCIDATVITQLVKDPQSWHFSACGDQ